MRKAEIVVALLLLLVGAMACNATVEGTVVDSTFGCPNGVAPGEAEIYMGEEFYLCGDVYYDGALLVGGQMHGETNGVMADDATIVNGRFSLYGEGNVAQHKYYYIDLSLNQPCVKEFEPVPVEIKTSCVMVPPSTIEAVPNVIEQGERFTLEVKNAPTDVKMEITGLGTSISTLINRGEEWSQSFDSSQCNALGSCVIHFEFTDQKHELCKASTDAIVTVKTPVVEADEDANDGAPLALATLLVLVIGTIGAVLLNRYL